MAFVPIQQVKKTALHTGNLEFGSIRGVDFRTEDTEKYRTPRSVNMYRSKLGVWETHPGFRVMGNMGQTVYDIELFAYTDTAGSAREKVLIHAGTKMYTWDNYPNEFEADDLTEIYDGMAAASAKFAVFNNKLMILDGQTLLYYDGEIIDAVENIGYRPQTWTGKKPDASAGTAYQQRNFISPRFYEGFTGDGTTKVFVLALKELDADKVVAWRQSNGEDTYYTEGADFTVDRKTGKVTFSTAPPAPEITGIENVFIEAAKTTKGYSDRINKCTEMTVFDNRIFLSGNPEYPNTVFWSGNGDFSYFGEIMFSDKAGTGSARIVAMQLLSSNRFLTIKEDSRQDGTYAVWEQYGMNDDYIAETYITSTGNSNIGCVSGFAHAVFMDDNVFLGNNGLNAISRSLTITNERNVEHRSSLVDAKLLNENMAGAMAEQHDGMLYILFPSGHCYIANASEKASNVSEYVEYEWAYLEDIGVYDGQTMGKEAYEGGTFCAPTCIRSLGTKELYFGAGGKLLKFNFDMETNGTMPSRAYHFNGRAIGDYVDSPFSWFSAANRYKKLIRKYSDLYCDTRSRSNIEVLYRTEKSHMGKSKVLEFDSGIFDFADIDFTHISFNTLPAISFSLRKIKGKTFRRLQVRVRSAGIYKPVAFKALLLEATIQNKRLK